MDDPSPWPDDPDSRRSGNHMICRFADGHVRSLPCEALPAARVGHARVDR
ncbi:hypothetical protein ACFY2W_28655 [Streptomyces sp. NPDC001262]